MHGKISPSLMCADFLHLESDLKKLEELGIEYLHIDIMDGQYVPNFTLGTDYIKAIRKATNIPLDIHMMIQEPEKKLEWFEFQEGDFVAIHAESTPHIQRALQKIKDLGAKPMLAINPATPICVLEDVIDDLEGILVMTVNPGFAGQKLVPQTLKKISRLKEWLSQTNYAHIEIEVDGNVSFENAKLMREAGADIFVAGTSSLFRSDMTLDEATKKLRENIQ